MAGEMFTYVTFLCLIACETSSAAWLRDYNKAECPGYGGRATGGGTVYTKR